MFITGALLFALGTLMVRREARTQTQEQHLILSSSKDSLEQRIDHIERLAMVGQPWCIDELRVMLSDSDERVRNASEDALLVIAARA